MSATLPSALASRRSGTHCRSPVRAAMGPGVRLSIPSAPWPMAGRHTSGARTSVIRSVQPNRLTPAAARTMASSPSLSSLRRRVSRFPRRGTMVRSGRWWSSWAWRRRLLVPTRPPRGRSVNRAPVREIRTSRGSSRSVMATMSRPAGRSVGTSFMLWTARSTRRSSRASSISLTKRALPPTWASGTSRILSPVVLIVCSSTVRSGKAARSRSATWFACQSASCDPRVPMTRALWLMARWRDRPRLSARGSPPSVPGRVTSASPPTRTAGAARWCTGGRPGGPRVASAPSSAGGGSC